MEPIFADKLSLTDDIPEQPQAGPLALGGRFTGAAPPFQQASKQKLDHLSRTYGQLPSRRYITPAEQMQGVWEHIKDTYGQPQPLPEPGLSPAAQRVRAEAARLGIDYDAEVTRILHGPRWGGFAPNPGNKRPGPDPLKNVSDYDRRMAEHAAAESIRRKHGIQLTWEEQA